MQVVIPEKISPKISQTVSQKNSQRIPKKFSEKIPQNIYCIGIKGSGVAALAVLLAKSGRRISGSDVPDVFFTDAVLQQAGIAWRAGFSAANIPADTELVIYSPAYTAANNAELAAAFSRGLPCMSYPEALGLLSLSRESVAVIGTHGKTTTTAFAGLLARSQQLDASILAGSALADFGGSPVWHGGDAAFFAEVCEYKNHFSHFHPAAALFTSSELDHPDFFASARAVHETFAAFLQKLPRGGSLTACSDDAGVMETLGIISGFLAENAIEVYLYGRNAAPAQSAGPHNAPTAARYIRVEEHAIARGKDKVSRAFSLHGLSPELDALTWHVPTPVSKLVDNAAAAIICVSRYMKTRGLKIDAPAMQRALADFRGIARRSEVLFQGAGITVMDDYAHHPTAIAATLAGVRDFFKPARLIANFMPHTYSRTRALWDDFTSCFGDADELIINDVYASAREKDEAAQENAAFSGASLAHAVQRAAQYHAVQRTAQYHAAEHTAQHSEKNPRAVQYIAGTQETEAYARAHLRSGDLFITLGAGDNFKISHALAAEFARQHASGGAS